MKQQRFRYRMLAFLTIGLLVVAGVYGVYSVSTYGSRWFANARNTRYQTAKRKRWFPGTLSTATVWCWPPRTRTATGSTRAASRAAAQSSTCWG